MYVYLSVSLSCCPHCFLVIIQAARNCTQRMQPQTMGSNTLSGSIMCSPVFLSVHPSVCLSFHLSVWLYVVILWFLYLYQFPVWGSSGTIHLCPNWVPKYPSGVQLSIYILTFFYCYIYLSVPASHFLAKLCADHIWAQHMWPKETVYAVKYLQYYFIPTLGLSQAYIYVLNSIYLYVSLPLCLVVCVVFGVYSCVP